MQSGPDLPADLRALSTLGLSTSTAQLSEKPVLYIVRAIYPRRPSEKGVQLREHIATNIRRTVSICQATKRHRDLIGHTPI